MPTESSTTACAADPDRVSGDGPCHAARDERTDPASVHIGHRLTPLGFAEERDHGDYDEERFETFAQQDGERPQEGRRLRRCIRCQRGFGIVEQPSQVSDLSSQLVWRGTAFDGSAILAHCALDRA